MGTFSKTTFPGLRIGFLVVPHALSDAFITGHSDLYRGGQVFMQAILADFMTEGYFASHIRRMRVLYGERLRLLQQAVERHCGNAIDYSDGDAGLHLASGCEARAAGIITRSLSGYYMQAEIARRGLMLGYTCVPNLPIAPAFDQLAGIIKKHWPAQAHSKAPDTLKA